jgi:proteasome lid subunit RPN8/RPN11
MRTTLVIPIALSDRLIELASNERETAGVAFGRLIINENGDSRLLVTEIELVPEECYDIRECDRLQIRSEGYVHPLRRAEKDSTIAIWFHTHPGEDSSPRPSHHDRKVDSQIASVFRIRTGSEFYGSLILSHSGDRLKFTGFLEGDNGINEISRLMIVGDHMSLIWNDFLEQPSLDAIFDRNVRAFGGDVQRILNDLCIAIVGCGGTGSAVVEQLARLGVRRFLLIDGDRLSDHNVTRVYGSTPDDVGRWKVDVLGDYVKEIAPDADVVCERTNITIESTARKLCNADVVFGCTDDNAGRLILSRLATFMLIPVFDCGVLLSSDQSGRLSGIYGRITIIYPGVACLICRDRIDVARAGAEMMTPDERDRLADEGYAPALGQVEPAVVSFTSLVASTAVSELLERFTGFGPDESPSEIILRIHDREISTNTQLPREGHYCDPSSQKMGIGITEPLMEVVWQK